MIHSNPPLREKYKLKIKKGLFIFLKQLLVPQNKEVDAHNIQRHPFITATKNKTQPIWGPADKTHILYVKQISI